MRKVSGSTEGVASPLVESVDVEFDGKTDKSPHMPSAT